MTALPVVAVVFAGIAYGVALSVRWRSHKQPSAARFLASPRDVYALTPRGVTESARRLRELDGGKHPSLDECGVRLGRLLPGKVELRAGWEETVLAIMGPRAGKTSGLAVDAVRHAPGAVVATSNKADLWMAADSRDGRKWTFDPQHICDGRQDFWWDPLSAIDNVEDAERLAASFVQAVEDESKRDIWGPLATELLAALFLAAHYGKYSVADAYRWLNNFEDRIPCDILRNNGYTAVAQGLAGIQGEDPRVRGSVYITARAGARCLRDPRIVEWVTPRKLPQFNTDEFVRSRDALHLLSKDRGGSAAPLVAALTDRVFRSAERAALRAGGRLDPPLVAVLDEAANVCPIPGLPFDYSHFGDRGIVPLTFVQSYAQLVQAWGHGGAKALWGASTVKLIGAGNDDASFANDISRLIGEHDVPTVSTTGSSRGDTSRNRSTRRERILSPGDIRGIERMRAVVIANGCRPAYVQFSPWFEGKDADSITEARRGALRRITEGSRA